MYVLREIYIYLLLSITVYAHGVSKVILTSQENLIKIFREEVKKDKNNQVKRIQNKTGKRKCKGNGSTAHITTDKATNEANEEQVNFVSEKAMDYSSERIDAHETVLNEKLNLSDPIYKNCPIFTLINDNTF